MPRPQRAAAHAAKSKFPNAVKLMKEADPEVKKEGNENKNKKAVSIPERHLSSKAKQRRQKRRQWRQWRLLRAHSQSISRTPG